MVHSYLALYTRAGTAAAMRIHDSFAPWMRSAVCLLSALTAGWTAVRGYWETDRLWVLLDRGGTHGSTHCSLSTVTAKWYELSSQSLKHHKSKPVKVARFVGNRFQQKKSPEGWFFVCYNSPTTCISTWGEFSWLLLFIFFPPGECLRPPRGAGTTGWEPLF